MPGPPHFGYTQGRRGSGAHVMSLTAICVKHEQDSRILSELLSIVKMAAYRAICAFFYTGDSWTIWGLTVTWQSKPCKNQTIGPVRRHCDFKMMSKEKLASRSHMSCHCNASRISLLTVNKQISGVNCVVWSFRK